MVILLCKGRGAGGGECEGFKEGEESTVPAGKVVEEISGGGEAEVGVIPESEQEDDDVGMGDGVRNPVVKSRQGRRLNGGKEGVQF